MAEVSTGYRSITRKRGIRAGHAVTERRRTRVAECAALLRVIERASESGTAKNLNFACAIAMRSMRRVLGSRSSEPLPQTLLHVNTRVVLLPPIAGSPTAARQHMNLADVLLPTAPLHP